MDSVGPTWIFIRWNSPADTGSPGIAFYTITITDVTGNTIAVSNYPGTGPTMINETGLSPNVAYRLTIRASSMALEVTGQSIASDVVTAATPATGTYKLLAGG